ncbi:MAG TPA: ADP-ribosylglycohydrolase family protein [Jatrophihabitans sp.]|uniref:ADP-ribosylglycohydrolase family protein n=1 Tax=Jatrophihabitans sp. TaxID=1932789 RepID=UPI002F18BCE8
MHDVLDPRDLIPDEAEQLAHSGYPVGVLESDARDAVAAKDLPRLAAVSARLGELQRAADWGHEEPEDDRALLEIAGSARPVAVTAEELPGRVRGAWLGRAVGNTLGKPIEGLTRSQVEIYLRAVDHWPLRGYLPLLDPLPEAVPALHPCAPLACAGRFVDVPRDDDLDWTILALHILEAHGREFTTEQVAAAWLDRVPFTQTHTAERAAYRNLIHGLSPPATATHDNPYREWIGALIRGDAYGYVCPGDPAEAAGMALADARLSHTANGKYGEMWAAALVASALAVSSAREALTLAHAVLPPRSRLAHALDAVLALHLDGASHTAALDWVDEALGFYPWVHTVNNAALIAIGLLWGSDFIDAVGITLSGGRDTDSNGATVGSVFGALHAAGAVPVELVGTTHVRVRSAVHGFDGISIDELAARTLRLVRTRAASATDGLL